MTIYQGAFYTIYIASLPAIIVAINVDCREKTEALELVG